MGNRVSIGQLEKVEEAIRDTQRTFLIIADGLTVKERSGLAGLADREAGRGEAGSELGRMWEAERREGREKAITRSVEDLRAGMGRLGFQDDFTARLVQRLRRVALEHREVDAILQADIGKVLETGNGRLEKLGAPVKALLAGEGRSLVFRIPAPAIRRLTEREKTDWDSRSVAHTRELIEEVRRAELRIPRGEPGEAKAPGGLVGNEALVRLTEAATAFNIPKSTLSRLASETRPGRPRLIKHQDGGCVYLVREEVRRLQISRASARRQVTLPPVGSRSSL
jgi:hypothetical protein